MRTFDEIWGNVRWGISFNSVQVRELVKRCLETDMTPEQIGEYARREINLIDKASLDFIQEDIENCVRQYRNQNKVVKNATMVLHFIYDRLMSIKRDISNALCFGLDKVDYTDSELEALNKLNQALGEFNISLKSKVPPCRHNCSECPVHGKRGCKIENNPVRAREWGIGWFDV